MIWLTSLPAWVLVVGGLAAAVLFAVAARMAVRALIPPAHRDNAFNVAAALMTAIGGLFALITALTLASEAGQQSSAQGIVSTEAADASRLAWAATSAGADPGPIHSALAGYLQATRTYEWHGNQAAVGDDPATSRALADLESAVRAQSARPSLAGSESGEMLSSLDALTADRRNRLAAASHEPAVLYVVVLVAAGAALITNATVLTLGRGWPTALPVGGLVLVVGLCLALLFALASPWRGSITVSGQPIDAIVRDLHTGYFHR